VLCLHILEEIHNFFRYLGQMDNLEWDTLNEISTAPGEQQDVDPRQMERSELLQYFGKAILLLLIMIVVVSIVIKKL
jgi:hypothetical protein